MLRLAPLFVGMLLGAATAQTDSPIEQSLPYEIVEMIDSYVEDLPSSQRGEPFVVLRGGWQRGDTLEVAVLTGPRSATDSLRFSQPGRVLRGGRYPYGVAFAGEHRGFQVAGGHASILVCVTEERPAYFIRYTAWESEDRPLRIVSAGERSVDWCMTSPQ
ncbi:MAG: hypothetical protein Rubg2KO_19330 [Rubricoccaceae bacterium]